MPGEHGGSPLQRLGTDPARTIREPWRPPMSVADLSGKIPNNVDLNSDRRLQRALESWQPKFIDWWMEMGPAGFQAEDVYLRTATSVDREGWAQFGYVRMPEYRWGIFL